MKWLSSVGIGLSVVFTCLVLALVAELYYLLWWKKRLTKSEIQSYDDHTSPGKELLHILCLRNNNPTISPPKRHRSTQNDITASQNDDRFLFTIVEETSKELELEKDGKPCGSRNRSLAETPYLTPLASSPPFLTPPPGFSLTGQTATFADEEEYSDENDESYITITVDHINKVLQQYNSSNASQGVVVVLMIVRQQFQVSRDDDVGLE